MDKNDIFEAIRTRRSELSNFGLKRIGLFGSYARGDQRDNSDIDLIVEFEPGKKSYRQFMGLCFFLDSVFGKKVEVLTPEGVSPLLKPYIDKEIMYEKLH